MGSHASQFTVRGIPEEVDRVLRQRAKQRNVSINQVIVDELIKATIGQRQVADFSDLVGRWAPDLAFDDILANQRQVDADDWR